MTLHENSSTNEPHHFPTHAAYIVPVEIKETLRYGEGHKGVFAMERIPKGTKLWVWTHRVTSIHHKNLQAYIDHNFGDNQTEIKVFLRQGFVLPPSSSSETMAPPVPPTEDRAQSDDTTTTTTTTKTTTSTTTPPNVNNNNNNQQRNDNDFFHSNPTDSGRLTNHSSDPNMVPDRALRDILPGEELTINYSFYGNPEWYQTICAKYEVLTESQIAAAAATTTTQESAI
jgi:hypothetical protein